MTQPTRVYARNRNLLILALLLIGLATLVIFANPAFHWWRTLILCTLYVSGALLLWAFCGNRYELTATELHVRFWPFEKAIPLSDIQSAESISWLWELLGDFSRMLHVSNIAVLQVKYRLPTGAVKRVWGLMPEKADQFLEDLGEAAHLKDERS